MSSKAPLFSQAVSLCCAIATINAAQAVDVALSPSLPGQWETIGRVEVISEKEGALISNGYVADLKPLGDYEMSFRAQAPQSSSTNVQIWAAIRVKDRDSRYAFGLRGGAEPQLSLARYAPDGTSKFLGFAPLNFIPETGKWYTLRVAVFGKRFHIYLNDEKLPRINIADTDALWEKGGIGLGGGWLPTEFADLKVTPLDGEKRAAFNAIGEQIWSVPKVDKNAERTKQRAAYLPAKIEKLPAIRDEFSLDGSWLFLPDQELSGAPQPTTLDTDDRGWHIIPVPCFWTPTIAWLHGESGLPGLKDLSANKGPSDKLMAEEYDRVNALTFDWKKTKSGWYRHHLDLPEVLSGKEFNLVFDAIAKTSEIWVNGVSFGVNIGMFRETNLNITKALKPGRNVITVHVIGNPNKEIKDANTVASVAVTVEVTNEMLNSLPHGMTDNSSGGIWQPVKLVVTNPARVDDVFIQPSLDSAEAEIEIENTTAQERTVDLSYTITENKSHTVLDASVKPTQVKIPANGKATAKIATPKLSPKLWTPAKPNLYAFNLNLSSGNETLDKYSTRFGFRTFTVGDGKLLLNGKPFWLRGGNHFPATLRPNDGALAHRFIELAREGNVNVTRSHALPFTTAWFNAADELGMGVSYEGTWPWLMLSGEPPAPALLKVWKDEFSSLLKKHRNHPSLLFWTVNNEMKFSILEKLGPEVLTKKWSVLDDMIKTMRAIDPTRPIVPDSAYTRKAADKISKEIREENKFDDGDIDDSHRYYGWYNESSFHLFDGRFGNDQHTPGRPLISQELSTGYPRNDDWPSRSYQFPRYVPQALVGNYSFEQNNPAIFMKRQAFMTKEVAEAIRRTNRVESSGVMHFAYLTWFTDTWKAQSIKPKLTYYELKKALQPVLVSAELYGRHFYAGDSVTPRVCIANDDEENRDLPAGNLIWEIRDGETVLATGQQATPPIAYYSNEWLKLDLQFPKALPKPRVDAVLAFKFEVGGKVFSENTYDVTLATREWATPETAKTSDIQLFDPRGTAKASLAGLATNPIKSLDNLDPSKPLIVGDTGALLRTKDGEKMLKDYVEAGGRVLLLQPGQNLVDLFPQQVKSHRATVGEIVTMEIPESPVFDAIEPLDTAWFEMGNRAIPQACSGTFEVDRNQPGVAALAHECKLHPDVPEGQFYKVAGAPIVEIQLGKGVILASEMVLSAKERDPIAGRLLRNMVHYLGSHQVKDPKPTRFKH